MAGYLGSVPVPQATQHRESFTCTEGQTTFNTAGYTPQFVDVYLNGSHLSPADFTASNGSDVVLGVAASADDVCDIISYTPFEVADQTFTGTIDITGELKTTTLGTSNFRAGVNAGNSIASGGNFNVVIGDEAGTALTTGDNNVAVGFEALSTEDANGESVAIGYRALKTQNAGASSFNTAVGYTAGTLISTGVQNAIFGGLAGASLSDADFNTALGTAALGSDTKGNKSVAIGSGSLATQNFTSPTDTFNIAIGFDAGNDITTGKFNTLIGGLSGDAIRSGDNNVAMGYSSLTTNILSDRNVAIGNFALASHNQASSIDSYNIAIGHDAGVAMTTGIRNTIIGSLAGDAITDSDFNVALGYASLSTNVLGSRNTAIGFGTLETLNPVDGNGANVAADTYNVAVGHAAGTAITTGIVNTYLGGEAGAANTVGNNNVALGFKALFTDSHGSQSVAVGVGALQVQDNGTTATSFNNTAVGYNAGLIVTTGVGNVLLGANAGSNVTTGGGNIIIGDSDGEAAGANHQIIMGNSVSGVGQDDFTFGRGGLDCNIAFGSEEITAPSDQRYKEDIADATAGLAFIKDLRPVTFKWRKEKDVPSDHPSYVEGSDTRVMNDYTNHGFIAQEVKTAIDAHSEIKDGFRLWSEQGLDEDGNSTGGRQRLGSVALIPILVKAIQELEARIATLEG